MSPTGFARRLAAPALATGGLAFLRGCREEVLVARIFGRLRGASPGYLSALPPSRGLTRTLCGTLRDLRLSGLSAESLRLNAFEVEAKAVEIKTLLAGYEAALRESQLADYARVLRLAVERLKGDPAAIPEETLVLAAEDMDFRPLERILWEAIPPENRRLLPVDAPATTARREAPVSDAETAEAPVSDAGLLRWLSRPGAAPPPSNDGTARIVRAVGEANEVREIFRRMWEEEIPFDDVEVLHTDGDTYVPIFYELATLLAAEENPEIPVTFAEGLPARYVRPGRALMAWISWIRNGFPQSTLAHMIQEGLLRLPPRPPEEEGPPPGEACSARLGAAFRTVAVGTGRDRYLPRLDETIVGLEKTREDGLLPGRENGEFEEEGRAARTAQQLRQRISALKQIRDLVRGLLLLAPEAPAEAPVVLESTAAFLGRYARCAGQMDEYGRKRLIEEIRELEACIGNSGEAGVAGLDIWAWLASLPREIRVKGEGPRPGRLFVSSLRTGGRSGRRHTFLVGLDDGRFPGAGLQDPLLLDSERVQLSGELPTAAGGMAKKIKDLESLFARLRGTVTLSYSCRSLSDEREMFPTGALLLAYRILSGNREGDQGDLLRWLPPPASFAPRSPERCTSGTEWWLWRLCGGEAVKESEQIVGENFPHLARGFRAQRERASDRFTEYDGYVPEAGRDLDPASLRGPVLSATRLETLGRCPMEYFFRYVLRIEPPEQYEVDPGIWLDPMEKGNLLHKVFCEFMTRLQEMAEPPGYERHRPLMEEILQRNVAAWRFEHPPPNEEVFAHAVEELARMARIFLQEEETFCRESRPICFEAAIGVPPQGGGTFLDSTEPVSVPLAEGKTIRVRGKLDRLDEVPGSGMTRFAVWDYKTGSSRRYKMGKPFQKGRVVQPGLYLALAETRLREVVSPSARVVRFGYFFPSTRDHGRRIAWSADQLAGGRHVLHLLCAMLSGGCFPFSDKAAEIPFSDYRAAFGSPDDAAEAVRRKLGNPQNTALVPFRSLREYEKANRRA
jgi:ATP-dependent helicase/nuclease subunit B